MSDATKTLLAGYERFRANTWPERRALCENLALTGQRPLAAIVACADSRLDPTAIFDAAAGTLFVVRNVANLVPPYQPDAAYHGTSAALEFAVKILGVSTIVVLGHAQCGGVQTLLQGDGGAFSDFILPWMQIAARARERVADLPADRQQRACEHATVMVSLENLLTFPWIATGVAEGALFLQGAHYGVATGELELLQPDGSWLTRPTQGF